MQEWNSETPTKQDRNDTMIIPTSCAILAITRAHEDCLAHGRLWREQWWLSAGAWVVLWVTAASLLLSIACRYGLFLVCWSCRVHEQYWVCVAHWSMSYIVIGTEHGSYRLSYTQKAGKWAVLSLYDHGDVKDDFVVRYLNGMNYCIHLLEHE